MQNLITVPTAANSRAPNFSHFLRFSFHSPLQNNNKQNILGVEFNKSHVGGENKHFPTWLQSHELNKAGNVHINTTLKHVRIPIIAVGKQWVLLHILSVSKALVTQHAKRMHHIILSSVACLALWYFSPWHNFRTKSYWT